MQKYELNLRDYWRIIKKRRYIVLVSAVVFPVITFAFTVAHRPPPVYESTASVRVERSMSLTGLFVESLTVPSGDMLATQALIIKSFPILEKVAKEMGLIPRDTSPDKIYATAEYSRTLSDMQGQIKTQIEGNTNIINITVSSGSPDTAQKLANLVAEKYREENILLRNKQVFEARKFIEEQLAIVESKLRTSEEELNNYKRKGEIISISDEQKAAIDRMSGIEKDSDTIDRELKETDYQLTILKKGEMIPRDSSGRLFSNTQDIVTRLNDKMADLMLERDNLLISYLPAHPLVIEVDEKIANVRSEVIAELESKRNALAKNREALSAELMGLRRSTAVLPATAMDLSRIERDVKINQDLVSLLKTKYEEALIKEAEKVEEVSIIKRSTEPIIPKSPPKVFLNTLLGMIIGIVFGLISAFVFETFDTSIGTIEDVEEFLKLLVIGVIPNLNTGDVNNYLQERYGLSDEYKMTGYKALISHFMPKSIVAESYRTLRTNALFMASEKKVKNIAITSSSTGEGKTITAINLAITMAQVGKRVLLIDVDFRNPGIHHYFGLEKEPGLSDIILGNKTWQDVVQNITDLMMGGIKVDDLMAFPGLDNINIITSGHSPAFPSEFLNSPVVPKLLNELSENYDFIICDAPPVLPVADAIILGSKVDGVFLLYKIGTVSRYGLRRAKLLIENIGATVLGVILNDVKPESSPDFTQWNYYYDIKEKKLGKAGKQSAGDRVTSLIGRVKKSLKEK